MRLLTHLRCWFFSLGLVALIGSFAYPLACQIAGIPISWTVFVALVVVCAWNTWLHGICQMFGIRPNASGSMSYPMERAGRTMRIWTLTVFTLGAALSILLTYVLLLLLSHG